MGVVAFWDLRTRRIPNLLIVTGLVLCLGCAAITNSWLHSIGGIGVAFGIGIVPFALRVLGGGDVKAAMVVGGFAGAAGAAKVILWTAAIAGVFAAIYWTTLRFRPSDRPSNLPVAVPLAIATWGLTLPFP